MKHYKNYLIIGTVLSILILIGSLAGGDKENVLKNNVIENISWKEMSYEKRQQWIEHYLKNPDESGYAIIGEMNRLVKNKFKYPKDVDFNKAELPTFLNARIVDAETGTVFVEGGGSAKNSFGINQGFRYYVRLKVTKDSIYIDDVSVSDFKK